MLATPPSPEGWRSDIGEIPDPLLKYVVKANFTPFGKTKRNEDIRRGLNSHFIS